KDVTFFSREYPLENMGVEESASAEWARGIRRTYSTEAKDLYEKHDLAMEPIIEFIKESADWEPTAVPTGEDVTEKIRQKARELGYGEGGGGPRAVRPPLRVPEQAADAQARFAERHLPGAGAGVHPHAEYPQAGCRGGAWRHLRAPGALDDGVDRLYPLARLPRSGVR